MDLVDGSGFWEGGAGGGGGGGGDAARRRRTASMSRRKRRCRSLVWWVFTSIAGWSSYTSFEGR
jgi:hypothetical protein